MRGKRGKPAASERRVTAADLRAAGPKRRTATEIATAVLENSKWRRKREIALLDAGVKKVDIERTLQERDVKLSHTTVSSVIAGTFRNDDVERVFCELTATLHAEMFPAKENAASAMTR